MPRTVDKEAFFTLVKKTYGDIDQITRKQIIAMCDKKKVAYPQWFMNNPDNKIGRGVYKMEISNMVKKNADTPVADDALFQAAAISAVKFDRALENFIPEKAQGYVPFGHFTDVRSIIKSKKFYPTYITGLSGNGKTLMVEQVCAAENRECIRVNVTIETDEDDLIGGFRLIDGRTVWHNGPVVTAMERGAILLLDEIDLGSNKLMCLQPVLEGKHIFLKKIGKVITPAEGFNIIATANTKGKGSEDGRFVGTNVMNEAFLERFSITMEQEYPPFKTEERILTNVLNRAGIQDESFVKNLVSWADITRKSFYEGAVSDIISTRRLVHICEAFSIFEMKREKAITMCLNRFDHDTKTSFLELYKKLDETLDPVKDDAPTVPSADEVAF